MISQVTGSETGHFIKSANFREYVLINQSVIDFFAEKPDNNVTFRGSQGG
jgi:hypothetical protein